MFDGVVDRSYRKVSTSINRIRHQVNVTPSRTLQENTELEGKEIGEYIEKKAEKILKSMEFTTEGFPKNESVIRALRPATEFCPLPQEQVDEAIKKHGLYEQFQLEISQNPVIYEDPEKSVNISVDDVVVKEQKEKRPKKNQAEENHQKQEQEENPKEKHRHYVHNTIAHIEKGDSAYIVNGSRTVNVLRIVTAFLLFNGLCKYGLIFFTDGQKTLHSAILKAFSWFMHVQIILDWYHLEDKCKKQLSMALKGSIIRNHVVEKLTPWLWYGLVDKAIVLLQNIDKESIKNQKELDDLINYLIRVKPFIPVYEIRKRLGLRNSSNIGEKQNDLIVSERQKHNGMSWSESGSVALASITTVARNNETQNWLEKGKINFKLAA